MIKFYKIEFGDIKEVLDEGTFVKTNEKPSIKILNLIFDNRYIKNIVEVSENTVKSISPRTEICLQRE